MHGCPAPLSVAGLAAFERGNWTPGLTRLCLAGDARRRNKRLEIHVPRGYRPKAQAKILFLLHALLQEIQECPSSHLSQEFSAINGLRLSTNDRFPPKAVPRHSHPWRKRIVFSGRA